MTIQKTKERAICKVICVLLLAIAAGTVIAGIAFLAIRGTFNPATQTKGRAIYLSIGLACLFAGLAGCFLEAFTLKALYKSNSYGQLLGFGIANSIFIITFPLTILMIIVAKVECRKQ